MKRALEREEDIKVIEKQEDAATASHWLLNADASNQIKLNQSQLLR